MSGLAGKVALITGAGRRTGIGAGIARSLIANGVRVAIADLGVSKGRQFSAANIGTMVELEELADELRREGGDVSTIVCDVRNAEDVMKAVDKTVATFGRLDLMINNAGVGYLMAPILSLDQDDWDAVIQVNLRGVFFAMKFAVKQMLSQGTGGRIISIASQAAKRGFPDLAAYVSSKHALIGLTRTAALEFAQYGITVNSVCPNHITTGLGASQNEFRAQALGISVDQLLERRAGQIPLRRVGRVGDIANMCVFLCSDEAAYVTGQNIDVSGGQEMH